MSQTADQYDNHRLHNVNHTLHSTPFSQALTHSHVPAKDLPNQLETHVADDLIGPVEPVFPVLWGYWRTVHPCASR